jgi:excisionase family DNA binding protein
MTILPPNTLPGLASYLLRPTTLEWFRKNDLALIFHDEIKVAVERARLAVDIPTRPETDVFVGPCIEGDCPGEITAHLPRDDEGEVTMRCDVCGHSWSPEQWRRTGQLIDRDAAVRPVWVSMREACEKLNISEQRLRVLIEKGRIREQRFSARRRLVRQDDVIRYSDERQAAG